MVIEEAIQRLESYLKDSSDHDREMAEVVLKEFRKIAQNEKYIVPWSIQWSLIDSSNYEQEYFQLFQEYREKHTDRFEETNQF